MKTYIKLVLFILFMLLLSSFAFFAFINSLLTGTFDYFDACSLTAGLFGMTATGLVLNRYYGFISRVEVVEPRDKV